MSIANVDLRWVETQRVGAFGGGGLEPQGCDRLPVNFDDRDVLFGHAGVEYGDAVEKDVVDQVDTFERLIIGSNANSTGCKEVAVAGDSYQHLRQTGIGTES